MVPNREAVMRVADNLRVSGGDGPSWEATGARLLVQLYDMLERESQAQLFSRDPEASWMPPRATAR